MIGMSGGATVESPGGEKVMQRIGLEKLVQRTVFET